MYWKFLLGLALLPTLAIAAQAPPDKSVKNYFEECGSCHVAYPPALLPAGDWNRIMTSLDNHYGDNAGLDTGMQRDLTTFLDRYAGSEERFHGAGSPPRLTRTRWFKGRHREVPRVVWNDPNVKGPSQCQVCHTRAEQGSYRERDIRLPGFGRYEDD